MGRSLFLKLCAVYCALVVLTSLIAGVLLSRVVPPEQVVAVWFRLALAAMFSVVVALILGTLFTRRGPAPPETTSETHPDPLAVVTADRNKLRTVLSGLAEGVVAVDLEGAVLHMNEAAGEFLGASPQDGLGRRIWEVSRVPAVSECLSDTLENATEVTLETRVVGSPRDRRIEIHASPLVDESGRPAGAVAVIQDLTELRRLESVRTDFVANVSHELKTPITAIRGIADTLVDDEAMPVETRQRFLGRVQAQSERLSALVTDLLTLARLEAEDGMADMQPVDLRPILLDAAVAPTSGDGDSEEVRTTLAHDVPGSPILVRGDPDTLRVAFSNLVENAFKYNPPGCQIRVRLARNGQDAVVEVEDDGIGIEPGHLDRIFERFYRVDKARSRELGGTGLGLAIVKHICLAHRGRVDVESAPGQGSTFRIRLPLARTP